MIKYIFIFFSICIITPIHPQTVGLLLNTVEYLNGYTIFCPNSSNTTYLINNCGEIINQWASDYKPGLSVYFLQNGNFRPPKAPQLNAMQDALRK